MGTVDMIRTMKQVHPNEIILLKVGKFFHSYGKDAYIIAFLQNYQLKKVELNTNTTGFPESALNKVLKVLEDNKLGYLIVDKSNNYEVIEQNINVKDSKYIDIYNKAHKYQNKKNKIDAIYEYLMNNINEDFLKSQIDRIEEIIYEDR